MSVHGHTELEVDVCICLIADAKLPVKTIEIGKFEYIIPTKDKRPLVVLDDEAHTIVVKEWQKEVARTGDFRTTYTDIVNKIIRKHGVIEYDK